MPCTCENPASDWLGNDSTTCTECGLEITRVPGEPIDLLQKRTTPFVYPKGRMSFLGTEGTPTRDLKSFTFADYLTKDPTPEESAEILSRWRSVYPPLADWSKTTSTGRWSHQEPEYQELPAWKDADHLAMKAYCKAAAQLDSARETMRLTDQYNAATEPLLTLVGELDFSEYETRILAWFGASSITYEDYEKMQRDLLDAGITITVVKGPQSSGKSTMILDLESGGGIISGFHNRQMGEMISQQLAKECAYEPVAEAHWETLRDRRHGRRKQRGKGKRK